MRVILANGERGASRSLLLTNNVKRIAINLTHFAVPTTKELDLPLMFEGAELTLYTSDKDEDVAKYDSFIREHHEDLTTIIGRPDYDGTWLGDKYVPMWNDKDDMERLAHLCEKYGRVAVSDSAMNKTTLNRLRQLKQRWGADLIGLTSKVDLISAIEWDAVIVGSWTSVMKFGETQVWDGHGLRRYSAGQKQSSRVQHRADIVRLGIDYDEVMEDDVSAVAALAIRSWLTWEMRNYYDEAAYDPERDGDDEDEFTGAGAAIVTIGSDSQDSNMGDSTPSTLAIVPPKKRHETERKLLPILGVEQVTSSPSLEGEGAGEGTEVDPTPVNVLSRSGDSLRQCDSCYLSSRCPAFNAGSECAYDLPLELKTRDQFINMLNLIIEMQVERTMFASFAEQLEGQGVDPTLSREFDRVFTMVEKLKDISDTRDLLSFKVEARAGSGVLERIFGAPAAEKMNELPAPVQTDDIMQELGIVDAEVVEE